MTALGSALDPLQSCPDGRYVDEYVAVEPGARPGIAVRRFPGGRVHVRHRLARLDDDLAETLAIALSPITDDHEVFARAFTGIVLTSASEPVRAWSAFYRASLARRGGYDDVYRHALCLLQHNSVLDLGCGFGLLSLRLAERGAAVTASDIDQGALRLLRTMSAELLVPVEVRGDTASLPDRSVEAVALVHVLEHLDESAAAAVLVEALRLADRTVVVGVPYEPTPNPRYGHVRRFDTDTLEALGASTGWSYDVHDHHGGWLVLHRTTSP